MATRRMRMVSRLGDVAGMVSAGRKGPIQNYNRLPIADNGSVSAIGRRRIAFRPRISSRQNAPSLNGHEVSLQVFPERQPMRPRRGFINLEGRCFIGGSVSVIMARSNRLQFAYLLSPRMTFDEYEELLSMVGFPPDPVGDWKRMRFFARSERGRKPRYKNHRRGHRQKVAFSRALREGFFDGIVQHDDLEKELYANLMMALDH